MNYYQHHIGDYRRDTAHLSLLEHGVYRQLLDMYYLSEAKIPAETEVVYRRLCARTDEEKKAVDTVLSEFFKQENGWVQTRCDKEIAEYQSKADRARINGKLGGRPSKTKEVISGNLEQTEEKANHKPITINQEPVEKPLRRKSAPIPADFQINEVSTAYAQDRKLDIAEELVSFTNWHTAKGSTFKDWQAAWRTWCDKAVEFGRAKGGAPPHRNRHDERADTIAELTGRNRRHEHESGNIIDITPTTAQAVG